MPAVEAWLIGGPADGRVMAVETTSDGHVPDLVRLLQTGMFVGTSDHPEACQEHVYERSDGLDGEVTYTYAWSQPRGLADS